MTVSLALGIIGTDDDPRWIAAVRADSSLDTPRCCQEGHYSPEAAGGHGGEIAALMLARHARQQEAGTAGALAIEKLGV